MHGRYLCVFIHTTQKGGVRLTEIWKKIFGAGGDVCAALPHPNLRTPRRPGTPASPPQPANTAQAGDPGYAPHPVNTAQAGDPGVRADTERKIQQVPHSTFGYVQDDNDFREAA